MEINYNSDWYKNIIKWIQIQWVLFTRFGVSNLSMFIVACIVITVISLSLYVIYTVNINEPTRIDNVTNTITDKSSSLIINIGNMSNFEAYSYMKNNILLLEINQKFVPTDWKHNFDVYQISCEVSKKTENLATYIISGGQELEDDDTRWKPEWRYIINTEYGLIKSIDKL